MIQRGDIVTYHKEPNKPLKVISDPYSYNGLLVVTAQTMGGMYERVNRAHVGVGVGCVCGCGDVQEGGRG